MDKYWKEEIKHWLDYAGFLLLIFGTCVLAGLFTGAFVCNVAVLYAPQDCFWAGFGLGFILMLAFICMVLAYVEDHS